MSLSAAIAAVMERTVKKTMLSQCQAFCSEERRCLLETRYMWLASTKVSGNVLSAPVRLMKSPRKGSIAAMSVLTARYPPLTPTLNITLCIANGPPTLLPNRVSRYSYIGDAKMCSAMTVWRKAARLHRPRTTAPPPRLPRARTPTSARPPPFTPLPRTLARPPMAATAAASPSSSLLLSRRHGASSSASRAGASRLRAPRCVLGAAEQLRVVEAGKRMGGADPWAAPWTPKAPAQEARLFALPQEARDSRLKIFSGTANRPLAQEIASYLGVDLGKILIKRFADGEIYVQLQESVRGCDVFLVQPTCSPVNENLMELFIMIDACRRASARSITVVIPYFGYARADRKAQGREAITAKLAANLLTEAGSDRVIVCDMHSAQALGYFDIPVDHIYGQPVILDYLASKTISKDLVVVSPDVGGVVRARAFAKKLSDAPLAIVDKRRQGHNLSEVMHLIGDVKGKVAIMVDDMIDTAGTITSGAALLKQEGAEAVYACCTHAVLSPPAIERLSGGIFEEVIVTNSILLPEDKCFPQLTVLSMANLVAETIWHVHRDGSVSSIFQ